MKRITKVVCSTALIVGMLGTAQAFSASAAIPPIITGDVDGNWQIDINDVTLLQNGLAGHVELTVRQFYAGDVNFNGVNDVIDVTLIQEHIAGKYEFERDKTFHHTIEAKNLSADYDSGKAMVGVPVTFTGTADGGIEPFTYEFIINKEIVQERSESNTFTYTFDKAGDYFVTVKCYNTFNESDSLQMKYTVVEPYESENPVICGIHTDKDYIGESDRNVTITAHAIMGTAPYQYKFTLDNGLLVQDYSDNNNFFINMYKLNYEDNAKLEIGDHTVLVEVKDANGDTVSETFTFKVDYNKM